MVECEKKEEERLATPTPRPPPQQQRQPESPQRHTGTGREQLPPGDQDRHPGQGQQDRREAPRAREQGGAEGKRAPPQPNQESSPPAAPGEPNAGPHRRRTPTAPDEHPTTTQEFRASPRPNPRYEPGPPKGDPLRNPGSHPPGPRLVQGGARQGPAAPAQEGGTPGKKGGPQGFITAFLFEFKRYFCDGVVGGESADNAEQNFQTLDNKKVSKMFLAISMLIKTSAVEKLCWSFKLYGKNKDGAVTKKDMLELMQVCVLSKEFLNRILVEQGKNNAVISLEEFTERAPHDDWIREKLECDPSPVNEKRPV
uniref:Si:ch211-245j22.3 n=1 Tax=Oryzias latipes TaxID=8090 RepID=A0A3B3I8C3_ORYLA